MKKLLLFVCLTLGGMSYAQTVKQDASGNYISVKSEKTQNKIRNHKLKQPVKCIQTVKE